MVTRVLLFLSLLPEAELESKGDQVTWTLNGVFTLSDMTMLQLMTSELPARYSSGVILLPVTLRSVEDSLRETLGDGTRKEDHYKAYYGMF